MITRYEGYTLNISEMLFLFANVEQIWNYIIHITSSLNKVGEWLGFKKSALLSEKSALSYERERVMKGCPIVKTPTKLPTFFSHKIAMFPREKRAAFEMRMEFSWQQMCSWTSLTRMKSTLVSQQLLRQFSDNCIVFRNNEDIVHYVFCVCCRICWEIKFWHMSRA